MPAFDRESGVGEHAGRPCARPLLLELQLRMRVDAMTQPDERPLRSSETISRAARFGVHSSVASHRARRRRNDRRRSVSDPGRRRSSSTYDGSLSPIVERPGRRRRRCRRRSTCCAGLVDVIGLRRDRERAPARLPRSTRCRCRAWSSPGSTGMELALDGERQVDPQVLPFLAGGRRPRPTRPAAWSGPGVIVERKAGISVTLHWRQCRSAARRGASRSRTSSPIGYGLAALRTRMADRAAAAGRDRQGHRGRRA